jgi:hypothetical protein
METENKKIFNFINEIKTFILLAIFAMVLGIFIKPVITEIQYINYVYSIFKIFILLFKIIILKYSVIILIFFITLIYKKYKRQKHKLKIIIKLQNEN